MADTDLINREPTLPGLAPRADIDRLVELFAKAIVRDEGPLALPRLPTRDERRALQTRQQELARAVRPISQSMSDAEAAQRRIALLCNGWSQNRSTDAAGLVATFVHDLMDLPLFAILQACDDVVHGRAVFRDPRGNDRKLDPAYPISSAQLYALAEKHAAKVRESEYRIREVLSVTEVLTPEASPEVRARVGAGLQKLADHFRNSITPMDKDLRERARSDALRTNTHQILKEYAALGIDPVYSAPGVLVSPSLARKLNPGAWDRDRGFDIEGQTE